MMGALQLIREGVKLKKVQQSCEEERLKSSDWDNSELFQALQKVRLQVAPTLNDCGGDSDNEFDD